jgi:hypothetical protein
LDNARNKRTGFDRRGAARQPAYFGAERRSRSVDRRSQFGRAAVLLERGDVRINEECANFGDRSFRLAQVDGAEVSSEEGELSLSWLLYGLLACITVMQAALDDHGGLWAIAAALALLSIIKWRQRRPETIYKLTIEAAGERSAVLETADRSEVHLIRDAIQMACAGR